MVFEEVNANELLQQNSLRMFLKRVPKRKNLPFVMTLIAFDVESQK